MLEMVGLRLRVVLGASTAGILAETATEIRSKARSERCLSGPSAFGTTMTRYQRSIDRNARSMLQRIAGSATWPFVLWFHFGAHGGSAI